MAVASWDELRSVAGHRVQARKSDSCHTPSIERGRRLRDSVALGRLQSGRSFRIVPEHQTWKAPVRVLLCGTGWRTRTAVTISGALAHRSGSGPVIVVQHTRTVKIPERAETMADVLIVADRLRENLRVKSGPCNVVLSPVWNAFPRQRNV